MTHLSCTDANMVLLYRGMVAINNTGVSLLQRGGDESTRSAIRTFKEALCYVKNADQRLHQQLESPLSAMSVDSSIKLATSQFIRYCCSGSSNITIPCFEDCSSSAPGITAKNHHFLSLYSGQAMVTQHATCTFFESSGNISPLRIELEDFGTLYPTDRDLEFVTVALLHNLGVSCLQLSRSIRSTSSKTDQHMMGVSVASAVKVLQLAQTMLCSIQFNMYQEGTGDSYNKVCCLQLESRVLQIMAPALQMMGRMEEARACSQRVEDLEQMIEASELTTNILPESRSAGAA